MNAEEEIDFEEIAEKVYKKALGHIGKKQIPLTFQATRTEMQEACLDLVEGVAALDIRGMIRRGRVHDGVHTLYLRKLVTSVFMELVKIEAEALKAFEEGLIAQADAKKDGAVVTTPPRGAL